jgi:uncharacterized protein YegL
MTDRTPAPDEPVHTWFLLDRSGSMSALHDAVVDGFNEFLSGQQSKGGATLRLTVVQFDDQDPHEVVVSAVPLTEMAPLRPDQFQPRGMTPLYDAIGRTIAAAEHEVAARGEWGLPAEDVVVVIFTDGLENASREWDHRRVFERIDAKRKEGWTFVFLGANQDSYEAGGRMGVDATHTSNFAASPAGMKAAFASVDRSVGSYRAKPRAARPLQQEDWFEGIKEAEQPDITDGAATAGSTGPTRRR